MHSIQSRISNHHQNSAEGINLAKKGRFIVLPNRQNQHLASMLTCRDLRCDAINPTHFAFMSLNVEDLHTLGAC